MNRQEYFCHFKRRILFITDHWTIGGREKSLKTIIENLSTEWECELLILRRLRNKIKEERFGYFPFPKNARITHIEAGTIIPIFFSLIKFLKRRKPHLISAHITPTGNLMLLLFLAKKIARLSAPLVITNHDTIEFPTDYYLTYFFRKYVLQRKIDCLVTISYGLREVAVKKWGVAKDKVITIHNPIAEDEIFCDFSEPPEYKTSPNSLKIVSVSRLDLDTKDFHSLLRAFSKFKAKRNEAKLFIIGDGPDKEKIANIIRDLKLEESVLLLGARQNPYPYIKYADLFIHSSFSEAMGRTIVEAMALGCPVVAFDCPVGPRELIGENENGLLVPMGNPSAMAEAMHRLLEDGKLRKRIVENGLKKAKEFLLSTNIRKREELFKELIGRRFQNNEL